MRRLVLLLWLVLAGLPGPAWASDPGAGGARVGSSTTGGWVWPLAGPRVVSRPFAPPATRFGAGHRGADLPSAADAWVRAAGAGRVSYAGLLAGRGVVVVVHGALRTTYEPVTAVVRVGSTVAAGAVVGLLEAGHPFCPAEACLHWGLRRGEDYLDPVRLVESGPVRLLPLGPPSRGASLAGGWPGADGSWPAAGSWSAAAESWPGAAGSGSAFPGSSPSGSSLSGSSLSGSSPSGSSPSGSSPSGSTASGPSLAGTSSSAAQGGSADGPGPTTGHAGTSRPRAAPAAAQAPDRRVPLGVAAVASLVVGLALIVRPPAGPPPAGPARPGAVDRSPLVDEDAGDERTPGAVLDLDVERLRRRTG